MDYIQTAHPVMQDQRPLFLPEVYVLPVNIDHLETCIEIVGARMLYI